MRRTVSSLLAVVGLAIVAVAPGGSLAANLTTLVTFCSFPNCADGSFPVAGLIADANGNLFGTTFSGGLSAGPIAGGGGTVFEIVKTSGGYATTPTTLATFCSLANCADGENPGAGLIADTNGNLFGTTNDGGTGTGSGANNKGGTVFEIVKTDGGYINIPTTLASFCSLPNCADGAFPQASLIADASGNLFGTTNSGGANGGGTVFEITGSGFVVTPVFAGTPGKANCHGQSVSSLARSQRRC
jgi:hypothetical protein